MLVNVGRHRTIFPDARPDRSLYRLGPVADGFTIMHLGDFETNGRWSLVRKGLDVSAFGLNVVEIEQGYSIPEHNELERDQEEVFIVLDGDAVMVIDGEDHPAPAGTFTRVAPPLQRTVRNDNEKPVRLLIVSAPTTSGYQDMGWA
jgi:mannose-6-phosphate isomerase-like protein (cupin superfamily)